MKTRIVTVLMLTLTISACDLQGQGSQPASTTATATPISAAVDSSTSGMNMTVLATPTTAGSMGGMNMTVPATPTVAGSMGGMNMTGDEGMGCTTNGMNTSQMEAGPHMHTTAPRTPTAADSARLNQLGQTDHTSLAKYSDYKLAEHDGFEPFPPSLPQQIYHFTNTHNAIAEGFRFDPTQPTSLLYKKVGSDYQLVGVMYTAPNHFSQDQLNARVPLSLAPWHQHVNLCMPPKGETGKMFIANPQFGLNGSIATQTTCDAAGGSFHPIIYDWMVHIYPFANS